jgi:transcriptional regulator with XRE-family HTH domain
MRVLFDPSRLRYEIQLRGLTLQEVSKRSHVSAPTIAAALAGRALNMRSALAVSRALQAAPPLEEMAALLPAPTPSHPPTLAIDPT